MSQGFDTQGRTVGSQPQDCKRATSAEARREEERGPAIEKSKFLWVDTGIINRDLLNVHSYQVGFVSLPSPVVPLSLPTQLGKHSISTAIFALSAIHPSHGSGRGKKKIQGAVAELAPLALVAFPCSELLTPVKRGRTQPISFLQLVPCRVELRPEDNAGMGTTTY